MAVSIPKTPFRRALPVGLKRRSFVLGVLVPAALLLIGFFYLYPFIWMLGSSLKTDREFFSRGLAALPSGAPQWENYLLAWEKAKFSQYFFNTVLNTAYTTIFIVILTSMAAYALARLNVPGKAVIVTFITVSFLLPRGYTIIPVIEIIQTLGLYNTRAGIILVYVAGGMIFNTFLFYGYMRTIPREIEESAIMDGAGVLRRYWNIVLPLSGPMIGTVVLFSSINTWNEFFTALVLTLGNDRLRTLGVGMYAFVSQNKTEWTLMCAAGIISIAPVVILYLILQRQFIDAFSSAVKG
jgi:raffinose/stachyose/melibiose transport system permease protein